MKSKIPDFRMSRGNVTCSFSGARFRKQYQDAQNRLDEQVMEDMVPFMPRKTGDFISRTKAESAAMQGTGRVMAAAPPFGYFLYWGKVMVDEETGSAWARPGSHKVVSDTPLKFSGNEKSKWFLEAKHRHWKGWLRIAKKTAGGG